MAKIAVKRSVIFFKTAHFGDFLSEVELGIVDFK